MHRHLRCVSRAIHTRAALCGWYKVPHAKRTFAREIFPPRYNKESSVSQVAVTRQTAGVSTLRNRMVHSGRNNLAFVCVSLFISLLRSSARAPFLPILPRELLLGQKHVTTRGPAQWTRRQYDGLCMMAHNENTHTEERFCLINNITRNCLSRLVLTRTYGPGTLGAPHLTPHSQTYINITH